MNDPESDRPTRVRYGVLTFLCVLAFIFYLDRVCIGQAAPAIQREMNLSNTQMGYVASMFTLAYGLFQVVLGRLSDRFGSRKMMLFIVVAWSIFTMATGLASGLVSLLIIRFLFGAGEAGAFPNIARIIARWFPPDGRSLPQGLINTLALVGGALAPLLAAFVMDSVDTAFGRWSHEGLRLSFATVAGELVAIDERPWWMSGWRWSFYLFGFLGIVWAIVFWFWYGDNPLTNPKVNQAERDYITRKVEVSTLPHPPVPWNLVLASRNVWLMGFVISCSSFVSYLFFSWYPTYLQKARGASNLESGWLAGLVLAGGAIGSALGGWLIDSIIRRTGERSRTRRRLAAVSLALAGVFVLMPVWVDSRLYATLITALAFFCAMLPIASWWGVVSDISGVHVATLFGLMNSLGVFGAIASQNYFGILSDYLKSMGYEGRAQYDPAFYGYSVALFMAAIGWCFIDANKSAVEVKSSAAIGTSS